MIMLSTMYLIILKKHLSFSRKVQLFFAYIKIRTVRLGVNRFISEDKVHNISVLGYRISINKFSDFYWTFIEVFIDEEYYFKTNNPKPVILDAGGHIGIATLYFKWLYPEAVITVFEPLPDNIKKLKRNIEVNKLTHVALVKKALDSHEGTLSFSGEGRAGHVTNNASEMDIKVPVAKLSKYVDGEVTFCKMDIEGSEAAVIQELENANKLKIIKHLVMEYHVIDKGNKLSDIIVPLELESFRISFKSDLDLSNIKERDFTHIMLIARHINI